MFLQKHAQESVKKRKREKNKMFFSVLIYYCSIILLVVTSINTNFLFGILSSRKFCVKLYTINTTTVLVLLSRVTDIIPQIVYWKLSSIMLAACLSPYHETSCLIKQLKLWYITAEHFNFCCHSFFSDLLQVHRSPSLEMKSTQMSMKQGHHQQIKWMWCMATVHSSSAHFATSAVTWP